MRVIRNGEIEVECSKCHCILAVTAGDIKDNMSHSGEPYFVMCSQWYDR